MVGARTSYSFWSVIYHKQVKFVGKTDVRNLDLDQIVEFSNASVTVYPVDSDKPEEGYAV